MTQYKTCVSSDSLQEIINKAWDSYIDPKRSFFPAFELKENLEKVYSKANADKTLYFYEEGDVWGVLSLSIDESAKYIQAMGGIAHNSNFEKVSTSLMEGIKNKYPGYTYISAYPSANKEAIQYLTGNGYRLVEALIQYRLSLKSYEYQIHETVQLMNESMHFTFSHYHETTHPEMYWNSERILSDSSNWTVMLEMENDTVVGSLGARHYLNDGEKWAEVYFNDGNALPLLETMLVHLRNKAVSNVLFFVEKHDVEMIDAVNTFKFIKITDYNCFELLL